MRFAGTCYRVHDPKWSFKPLSGADAAIRGGRFNPKDVEALYLSLDIMTAVREANQGFTAKIDPCVMCCYEVDCADIVDLGGEAACAAAGVDAADMSCAWLAVASQRKEPPSWAIARRLIAAGSAGILVPSFAVGATAADRNLVLWRWASRPPHQVTVYDPSGRLPKNQLSWD